MFHPGAGEKEATSMEAFIKEVIGIAAVMVVMTAASSASVMMSSWQEARKVCEERLEKKGKTGDNEAMRTCCDNMILVADIKENGRLVEMCITNGMAASSQKSGEKKK